MKKNVLVFAICLVACGAIFTLTYTTDKQLDQKSNSTKRLAPPKLDSSIDKKIIDEQVQKLANKLEVQVSEDQLFNDLNNFKIEISDLKKNLDKSLVKSYIQKQSRNLITCLKKDYCGTKPDPDGYFDEFSTPGHILLSRELRLLNSMLDSGDLTSDDLEFYELVKFENKNILESTAELFLKSNPSESELATFLDSAVHLEGAKKQVFYSKLISKSNEAQRDVLISSLAQELKSSTPYSVVAFFQKLSAIKLTEDELMNISRSGCKLEEDNEVSWNSFSYNFKKYVTENSFDLLLDEVCP